MALTISIEFLTGRANLHHWQAHHSDGKVDWPPSPWRLLRALVAVAGRGLTTLPQPDFIADPGKKPKPTKQNPTPSWPFVGYVPLPDKWCTNESTDMIPLSRLAELLSTLSLTPEIWLPKTSGGHTRQYFPVHEAWVVKNSGTAVFDTFAVVHKDQAIFYHWPNIYLELQDQRLKDLELILQRLTYFGRAESWCHARVTMAGPEHTNGVQRDITHWPCVNIENGAPPAGQEYRDYTLERKLAPLPMGKDVENDLATEVRQLLPITKSLSSSRRKHEKDFGTLLQHESPDTLLLRCLLRESGQDMKDGLERPIGTRWVHYAVPRAIYNLPRPARKRPQRTQEFVQVVKYSLNTASIHRPVLPPLTDTLLVADKFRSAALALYCAAWSSPNDPSPRNLCGREEDGSLCQDHDHAFFWPMDEDNDGFIDHVIVYCPSGFSDQEVDALRALCRIRQRSGRPDLLITPLYVGEEENFRPWLLKDGKGTDHRARMFVSATPYFCPIHLTHGKGSKGRPRPITREIIKGMHKQGIIADEGDVASIQEFVFDYAPDELAEAVKAMEADGHTGPVPPRQFFPVIEPPPDYPPLPLPAHTPDHRFAAALLKDPDAGFPFGLSVGLLADEGRRFIRAMAFCRRRRNHQVKGYGRMLQIEFKGARKPQPFAIGDQCHFGLGLFVPSTEH